MIERPRLKSFLTVFPVSDNTWGLRGGSDELWRIKLQDERAMQIFGSLLPYLNGKHRSAEILDKLEQQDVPRAAAEQMLLHLEKSSLVEEADTAGLGGEELERYRDQITFFSRFSTTGGSKYQAGLRRSHVGIVGGGTLSRSLWQRLDAAGIGEVTVLAADADTDTAAGGWSDGEGDAGGARLRVLGLDRESIWPSETPHPRLLIVPQDSHDPQLLEAVDACSKHHKLPWLLVRAVDLQEGWVGPLFVPGETASYLSLDARLKGNLPFYEDHQAFDARVREAGEPSVSLGGLHSFFDMLSSVAVIEVIKYLSGIGVPHLAGRFLTVNMWNWDVETHEVLRVPGLDRDPAATRPAIFPWQERSDDKYGKLS